MRGHVEGTRLDAEKRERYEHDLPKQDWEVFEQRATVPPPLVEAWELTSGVVLVEKAIDRKIRTKHLDVLHYYTSDPGRWLVRLILRAAREDIRPVYPDLPRSNRWRIWTHDETNGDELLIVLSRSKRFSGLELTTFFRPNDPTYRSTIEARDRLRERKAYVD